MSCPNKLVNAKSKNHFKRTNGRTDRRTNERTNEQTNERTNGVTWSLLELLIAAKNPFSKQNSSFCWGWSPTYPLSGSYNILTQA